MCFRAPQRAGPGEECVLHYPSFHLDIPINSAGDSVTMNDEITRVPDQIARKSENFNEWYTDVVRRAELADYSAVRGCMIIRPYGYALW